MNALLGFAVGYFLCRLLGFKVEDLFKTAVPLITAAPKSKEATIPAADTTTTVVTHKTEEKAPAGLPPWPSGWKAHPGPTSGMVSRAWALLPILKLGERKVEVGPAGEWLSYWKYKNPNTGKLSVAVFVPKVPVTTAPVTV